MTSDATTDESTSDETAEESSTDGTATGETVDHPQSAVEHQSSLLWGVVGALAFLVLIQGYELLADEPVSILVKAGVALVVGVVAGVATHMLGGRVPTGIERS